MQMRVCLHVYLCTISVPGTYRCQRWASDPLELELQIGMRHSMDVGNQSHVLCKRNNDHKHWALSSPPFFGFWLFLLGLDLEHRDSCMLGKCSTTELYIPRAGELSLQVLNPQQQLMRLRPVPRSKAAPLVTLLMMFSSVSHTASHLLCKASAQQSNLQFWAPNPSKDLRHYFPLLFLLQLFTTVTTDVCPWVLPSTVWSDAVVS